MKLTRTQGIENEELSESELEKCGDEGRMRVKTSTSASAPYLPISETNDEEKESGILLEPGKMTFPYLHVVLSRASKRPMALPWYRKGELESGEY